MWKLIGSSSGLLLLLNSVGLASGAKSAESNECKKLTKKLTNKFLEDYWKKYLPTHKEPAQGEFDLDIFKEGLINLAQDLTGKKCALPWDPRKPAKAVSELIRETYEPIFSKRDLDAKEILQRVQEMNTIAKWVKKEGSSFFEEAGDENLKNWFRLRRIATFEDLLVWEVYRLISSMIFRETLKCTQWMEPFEVLWGNLRKIGDRFKGRTYDLRLERMEDSPILWRILKNSLTEELDQLSVDLHKVCSVDRHGFLNSIEELLVKEDLMEEEERIRKLESQYFLISGVYRGFDPIFGKGFYWLIEAFQQLQVKKFLKEAKNPESIIDTTYRNVFYIKKYLNLVKPEEEYRSLKCRDLKDISEDKRVEKEVRLAAFKTGGESCNFPKLSNEMLVEFGFWGNELEEQAQIEKLKPPLEVKEARFPRRKSVSGTKFQEITQPSKPGREKRKSVVLPQKMISHVSKPEQEGASEKKVRVRSASQVKRPVLLKPSSEITRGEPRPLHLGVLAPTPSGEITRTRETREKKEKKDKKEKKKDD